MSFKKSFLFFIIFCFLIGAVVGLNVTVDCGESPIGTSSFCYPETLQDEFDQVNSEVSNNSLINAVQMDRIIGTFNYVKENEDDWKKDEGGTSLKSVSNMLTGDAYFFEEENLLTFLSKNYVNTSTGISIEDRLDRIEAMLWLSNFGKELSFENIGLLAAQIKSNRLGVSVKWDKWTCYEWRCVSSVVR